MMVGNTTHQYALDKMAQDQVEGRSPMVVGCDFGVEDRTAFVVVNVAGEMIVERHSSPVPLDIEKLRQDLLVSRMTHRASAWRRMRDWLTGGSRHGR